MVIAGKTKVQTNLKLAPEAAVSLDVQAAVDGKDKARIVEEALRLRQELMGADYSELIQAALVVRFSKSPEERLRAATVLRHDVPGSSPDRSVTVTETLAELADAGTPA